MPALAGITLQPAFDVKLDGPLDRSKVEMNVQSSAGQLSGTVTANVAAPRSKVRPADVRPGEVSVRHLDLSPILNDPRQKSDITANARFDLHGRSLVGHRHAARHGLARLAARGGGRLRGGADSREGASRRAARGARRQRVGVRRRRDRRRERHAAGRQGAARLRPSRRARHVDLRQLPREAGRPARGHQRQRRVSRRGIGRSGAGAGPHVDGDLRFEPSTVAGAKIASGQHRRLRRRTATGRRLPGRRDGRRSRSAARRHRVRRPGAGGRSLQEHDQRAHRRERPRHDAAVDGPDGERHARPTRRSSAGEFRS